MYLYFKGVKMKTVMDLSGFTGTENYWRTCAFAPKLVHTDGVQYFADHARAYWFLDIIGTEFYSGFADDFVSIKLTVKNNTACITVTDGDDNVIKTKDIEFTDCPEGIYKFFLTNNVLMLTSEY